VRNVFLGFVAIAAMFLVAIGMSSAQAAEYYGTPIYYSKFTQDSYDCVYDETAKLGYCGDKYYPQSAVIGYKNGERLESAKVRLIAEVTCIAGDCRSSYGEPYGKVNVPGTSYWSVPVGFYIDVVNTRTKVFRHGTGRLAVDFPIRDVINLPEYLDPPRGLVSKQKDTQVDYDVYCNPAGDCSYKGQELEVSQLHTQIPTVLTHNCAGWFCFNPDQTIAGLNPRAK
jgi:hypothetical protein